ncbi:lysozyme family protein [Fictibacillus sp. Mic-4]|uniref:lysozyme family protein n=1 Tax=Fictibacillus TaxID=1329200 RepID=UPI00041E07B3|nr:lysozyme family protein [Fictibacillus gelatini]HAJ3957187.1 peptidoglycan DD-metalloendopeptidase family protein [Escherichia coli]
MIKVGFIAIKSWRLIVYSLLAVVTIIFFFFFAVSPEDLPDDEGGGGTADVSPLVLRYEPIVRKYAKKYGVEKHVPLLLAQMQQESGGRGNGDPFQASESLCGRIGCITDPEKSIEQGVKYFSKMLKSAGGDYKLALQAYNFGGGYIDYAKKHGGHSRTAAMAFSNMMATKMGWGSYGDPNYVDHVLRYFKADTVAAADVKPNKYGFIKPLNTQVTSGFGVRIDPITGLPGEFHGGIDFSCNRQPLEIRAIKDGVVTREGWQDPGNPKVGFGQRIYISHGGSIESVYGHLSKILVKNGQKIKQGQVIGKCGTTGSSTGMHLHLEIHVNGQKENPAQYVLR